MVKEVMQVKETPVDSDTGTTLISDFVAAQERLAAIMDKDGVAAEEIAGADKEVANCFDALMTAEFSYSSEHIKRILFLLEQIDVLSGENSLVTQMTAKIAEDIKAL